MNRSLRICFKSKREDSKYENHLKAKVLPLGPRYWEILPGRLEIFPDLKSFKNEVKKYYRDMFIEDGFV